MDVSGFFRSWLTMRGAVLRLFVGVIRLGLGSQKGGFSGGFFAQQVFGILQTLA